VQLYEIECVDSQPLQRPVNESFDVGATQSGQRRQIRHALGVHANGWFRRSMRRTPGAEKVANKRFDAGVNVGTVERSDTGLGKRYHISDGPIVIDRAMSAGQLPSPLDESRDDVSWGECSGGKAHRVDSPEDGNGTAVTSAW